MLHNASLVNYLLFYQAMVKNWTLAFGKGAGVDFSAVHLLLCSILTEETSAVLWITHTTVGNNNSSQVDFFFFFFNWYYVDITRRNNSDPYIVKNDTKLLTACISATFQLFALCILSSFDRSLFVLLQCFPFIYKRFYPDEAKTSHLFYSIWDIFQHKSG